VSTFATGSSRLSLDDLLNSSSASNVSSPNFADSISCFEEHPIPRSKEKKFSPGCHPSHVRERRGPYCHQIGRFAGHAGLKIGQSYTQFYPYFSHM